MQKIIDLIVAVVRFFQAVGQALWPRKADVTDKNLDAIAVGLDMAHDVPEVIEARRTIHEISSLPESDREKRSQEVADAQAIVEKHVAAEPVLTSDSRRKSILEQIKEAEAAKKASSAKEE